jgi:hypothetical protein
MATSKKISALPSLAGAQVGADVLTALDVSQVAALQNVQTTLDLFFGNVPSPTIINTPARTTPATSFYTATRTPADLALTADTESVGIQLGGNASLATVTRQFTAGGGAFGTQREIVVVAPTYAATGAETIMEAATFAITGPPAAGTNMTLTNSYSFWVQSGLAQFDSVVHCESAARVSPGALDAYFEVKTPADTGLLSGTENVGIGLGGDANFGTVTRQFAPGALAVQREIVAVAPTYAFVSASTLTTAATFAITNQPQAGTNATITNAYAFWVQAGKSQLAGSVTVAPAARTGTAPIVFQVVTPADTALTASTESILNQFGGSTAQATVTRQFATGALTTQRENLFVAPTYGFVGASTLTNAATVAITGAPVAGTNATITNSYALWSQGGLNRFDGKVYGDAGSGTTPAGQLIAFGGLYDSSSSSTTTSGTGSTTLYSLTIGANVMATNGDLMVIDVFGRISQDGGTNADFSFNLEFDGVSLHTETQNTNSNFQHYTCRVTIQRVSTTTANVYISWNFSRYGQSISNNGGNYGAQLTDQFSKVQVIPGSAVTNWTAGRVFNFNATTTNSGAPILKDGAIALKFSL